MPIQTHKKFFADITEYLNTTIAPISNQLDNDVQLLKSANLALTALGSKRFFIPVEYGGFGGERVEWVNYNILMAQYSGALLFLQAQHQFVIEQLKKLLPEKKVQERLRHIAETNVGVGLSRTAFSHGLQITSTAEGHRISGKLPWVTGWEYYDAILMSFIHDNHVYYTVLPFQPSAQNAGSISFTAPLQIAVFSATNTVSVILDNWLIPSTAIIAEHALQPYQPKEHPTIYNFAGAIKALLKIIQQGRYGSNPTVQSTHAELTLAWENYVARILQGESCPLTLRAEGLQLAERCAAFARIVCGAEALLTSHPLTRLSREIWQYAIAGYSKEQLEVYLESFNGDRS